MLPKPKPAVSCHASCEAECLWMEHNTSINATHNKLKNNNNIEVANFEQTKILSNAYSL